MSAITALSADFLQAIHQHGKVPWSAVKVVSVDSYQQISNMLRSQGVRRGETFCDPSCTICKFLGRR